MLARFAAALPETWPESNLLNPIRLGNLPDGLPILAARSSSREPVGAPDLFWV
jgi:hypothetical protein